MVNDPKPDVQEGGDKPEEGSENPQAKPKAAMPRGCRKSQRNSPPAPRT